MMDSTQKFRLSLHNYTTNLDLSQITGFQLFIDLYPFTLPAAMPAIKVFWFSRNTTMIGSTMISVPAVHHMIAMLPNTSKRTIIRIINP